MYTCSRCKHEIKAGDLYCSHCGEPIWWLDTEERGEPHKEPERKPLVSLRLVSIVVFILVCIVLYIVKI